MASSRGLCGQTPWKATTGTVGETDIDITQAVYTAFVLLLTIANESSETFIDDCYVHFDLDHAATGFGAGYTSETIQFGVARAIDGTNYKIDASTADGGLSATCTGTLAATNRAMGIHVGPIGPDEDCRIYVTVSTEVADVDLPYVVYYRGTKPTITEVAAV